SDIIAVAGLTNLTVLDLSSNEISDISTLAGLNNLEELHLFGNRISDIKPLADNIGISSGDTVLLYDSYSGESNPLSTTSCTVYIPQLQDRGVTVRHNCSSSVIFPDENLEAVIRQAINKPSGEILESDLQGITELYYTGMKDIENIEGLQYCTKLDQLDLSFNQINDISAVAGLTNLTELRLYGNEISDIIAVAGLTNLTVLDLYYNGISDISAVAGLTNLTELRLYNNEISD
ncbi:MAG: leucine-rich repeat domain-containing protein, partial [Desulfobacterales bacterium]|nr:leucine-rich repeat domain-containing protein [Desulfobacterales bacterium]